MLNDHCHRVSTHLQSINIIIIITVQRNAKAGILANGIQTRKGNHDTEAWKTAHRSLLVQAYQPTFYHLKSTWKTLITHTIKRHPFPSHQFGFRKAHSTIQQCHRLTTIINKTLEDRQYCSAVFLDISQAFGKVWHQGLLLKIQQTLPPHYFNILQSYLQTRQLVVTYNNSTSQPGHMLSGVPQSRVLGPFLYTLYTADIPQSPNTALSTFADDTAILSNYSNPITATANLQTDLHSIEKCTRKWKIKINEEKSKHVTFSLRRETVLNSSSTRPTSPKRTQSNTWGYTSTGDLPVIATSLHYGNTWTSGPKNYTES